MEENVKYTEDMDCSLKLFFKAKKIEIINSPFYVYRQNENSATHFCSIKRVEDTMNFVLNWNEKIQNIENNELKEYLFSFVKYQYSIVVGMLFLLNKNDKKILYLRVKKYENLLLNGEGKKGKLVHYCYRIFGFNITGKLLALWIKTKNKIKV